jgi:NAD(P)-dependent dehydrogenase (short-subunit alcohol dehydrogenase family)
MTPASTTTYPPIALFDLSGRRALVTGARRGIGRAIAEALAAQGAEVAVHHAGTAEEAADACDVVATIAARGGTAVAVAADFADPGAGSRLADEVGAIDILVLNASIEMLEPPENVSTERFDRQIAINLRSPLELLQAILPGMKQRGWGRIVAIGSVQQVKPHPDMLIYAGTKAAQLNWVRNLARHIGPCGVTVNNLAPGAIWTARNDQFLSDPAFRDQMERRIPLGRVGRPDDLVGAAMLLCSDAGRYINGADILVDGGMSVL